MTIHFELFYQNHQYNMDTFFLVVTHTTVEIFKYIFKYNVDVQVS